MRGSNLAGGISKVQPSDDLTPRQREVVQLLGEGRSMKERLGTLTCGELGKVADPVRGVSSQLCDSKWRAR